jgi:hypothetical protein
MQPTPASLGPPLFLGKTTTIPFPPLWSLGLCQPHALAVHPNDDNDDSTDSWAMVSTPCPPLRPDPPANFATGIFARLVTPNLFSARFHPRLLEAHRSSPSYIAQATLVVDLAAVATYKADEAFV